MKQEAGFVRYVLYGIGGFMLLVVLLVAALWTYATVKHAWLKREARLELAECTPAMPAGTPRAQVAHWAADHHILLVSRGASNVPEDMLLVGRSPVLPFCEDSYVGVQVRYSAAWPTTAAPADPVQDLTAAEWPGACL